MNFKTNAISSSTKILEKTFLKNDKTDTDFSNFYDQVYCKKLKMNFTRQPDLGSYDQKFSKKILEFRPVMLEGKYEKLPFLFYVNAEDQNDILNNFDWKWYEEKLKKYEYHDLECTLIAKFGLKNPKFFHPNINFFDEGMCYEVCKEVYDYFDENVSGPFTKEQILNKFSDPVIVGKILPVIQPDKTRLVIDRRGHKIQHENLQNFNFKLRLPSLRELFLFTDMKAVKAASLIDFSKYFRQLPMNEYNACSCVLTKEIFDDKDKLIKKEFYIDKKGAMGAKYLPMQAQRITSSLNYIYNCEHFSNLENKLPESTSIGYEDDTFILHFDDTIQSFDEQAFDFVKISRKFGLKVKDSKNVINSKVITWLGIEYHFDKQFIKPSTRRISKIKETISTFKSEKSTNLREIQSFLGRISSFTNINHLKALMFNLRALDTNKNEGKIIIFSKLLLAELELISKSLDKFSECIFNFDVVNYIIRDKAYLNILTLNDNKAIISIDELIIKTKKFLPNEKYALCVTDSSMNKSGGYIISPDNQILVYDYDHDSREFEGLSIDKFECIVLVVAGLLVKFKNIKCEGIIFFTDSEVTRYILVKNNAKSELLKKLTTYLSYEMSERKIWWHTKRISTVENYLSDRISRNLQYKLDRPFTKVPDGEISLILKNLLSICFGMNYLGFIESLTRSESGLGLGTVSEI